MSSEQFQQWLKGVADAFFGFIGFALNNLTMVAIYGVVGVLVLALVIGTIGHAVRKRRDEKEARRAEYEASRSQDG